jgi:hypothetical protein
MGNTKGKLANGRAKFALIITEAVISAPVRAFVERNAAEISRLRLQEELQEKAEAFQKK